MKKIILAFSFFTFLAFAIISCKKDHTPAQQPDPTPTVANISGDYTIAKITLKNTPTGQEVEQTYPDCKKDDELHFSANMVFNYVDAGTVCQSPGDWSGAWALPNSTTLEIDGSPATIIKFNGTNLNLSAYYDDTNTLITYLVKKQ
jgi:hypothetical protein